MKKFLLILLFIFSSFFIHSNQEDINYFLKDTGLYILTTETEISILGLENAQDPVFALGQVFSLLFDNYLKPFTQNFSKINIIMSNKIATSVFVKQVAILNSSQRREFVLNLFYQIYPRKR